MQDFLSIEALCSSCSLKKLNIQSSAAKGECHDMLPERTVLFFRKLNPGSVCELVLKAVTAIAKPLQYSNVTRSGGNSGVSKVCGDQLALTDKTSSPSLARLPAVVRACLMLPQHKAFRLACPSWVN